MSDTVKIKWAVGLAIAIAATWYACGRKAHDLFLGDFTHRFPSQCHEGAARVAYIFGPFALIGELTVGPGISRHIGLTRQQRWEAFHQENPESNFHDFEQQSGICAGDEVQP